MLELKPILELHLQKNFPELVPVSKKFFTDIETQRSWETKSQSKNFKKFYDFALDPEIQMLASQAKAYQVPSNGGAKPPPQAPDLSKLKLIDYDFAKYGSSAERKRLLSKWDDEVSTLPR